MSQTSYRTAPPCNVACRAPFPMITWVRFTRQAVGVSLSPIFSQPLPSGLAGHFETSGSQRQASKGSTNLALSLTYAYHYMESRLPCGSLAQKLGRWSKTICTVLEARISASRRIGRNSRIRTCDPLVPNQMRYQAALRSDAFLNVPKAVL